MICFISIKVSGQVQVTRYTPTGVSVFAEKITEYYSEAQIAAATVWWQDSIVRANWSSATIISPCSSTYNCHAYSWHMSDGGDAVWISSDSEVAKYYNGSSATYKKVDNPGKYRKVNYNGASHSAVVDSNNINWVYSKWGSGPVVRHAPGDSPYSGYTLEYYELIIDNLPNSVAKGCAINISALNINNASYNWSGDNFVCAAATTNPYTGSVTGLDMTPSNGKGEVKVEITSRNSNTTVKGIKEFSVTSAPSNPYISGSTLVCPSGGSFMLHNVPAGNTVTWSFSSNLSTSDIHANPCTFVSIGNESGWVDATVSTVCHANNFPNIAQFEVWSGSPAFSSISGPMSTPNNQWTTYYAEPNNSLMAATNFNWILNPLNGNSLHNYGRTLDIAFYNSGTYQLVLQAKNTCSGTAYGPFYVTGLSVYDSRSLTIYPNPTDGETTISIESISEEKAYDENPLWEMEVYTQNQVLKEKKSKQKDNKFKINTSNWQEGIYIVRVKFNNTFLQGKLVVKR